MFVERYRGIECFECVEREREGGVCGDRKSGCVEREVGEGVFGES